MKTAAGNLSSGSGWTSGRSRGTNPPPPSVMDEAEAAVGRHMGSMSGCCAPNESQAREPTLILPLAKAQISQGRCGGNVGPPLSMPQTGVAPVAPLAHASPFCHPRLSQVEETPMTHPQREPLCRPKPLRHGAVPGRPGADGASVSWLPPPSPAQRFYCPQKRRHAASCHTVPAERRGFTGPSRKVLHSGTPEPAAWKDPRARHSEAGGPEGTAGGRAWGPEPGLEPRGSPWRLRPSHCVLTRRPLTVLLHCGINDAVK